MENKILIFAFLFISFLQPTQIFAQYEWSEPIQLSEDGNYPATTNSSPAITVDSNGVIYAFWVRGIETEDPFVWRCHIEFRKSADGGQTWSEIENITPENTESRLYRINAVCDSQNNVHIVYKAESTMIYYKKYDGTTWSSQEEIYYCNNGLNLKIDSNNRLYAIMWSPTQTYYAYHEASDTNTANWTVTCISAYENMYMKDFTFDADNNIHAVGEYYIYALDEYRPFYMKYDRSRERWGTIRLMDYIEEASSAQAIILTNEGNLISSICYGTNDYTNKNFIYTKSLLDTLWQNAGYVNSNMSRSKEMLISSDDHLHFVENEFSINANIIYTTNVSGSFLREVVQSDTANYSYGPFDVELYNNRFIYSVYGKSNTENFYNYIYFQSRQIETGIDDPELTLPATATLNQNYPNPFNNETEITFSIPKASEIQLNIYNIKGEIVKSLLNKKMNKGIHSVNFQANVLNTGIYFYQLVVNGKILQTKSMLYLK